METFIEYKGMLLLRHEWFGGERPKDKVLEARKKLVKRSPHDVRVITNECDFDEHHGPRPKIQRKV